MATFEKVFVSTTGSPFDAIVNRLRFAGRDSKEIRGISTVRFDPDLPWLVVNSHYPTILDLGSAIAESLGVEVISVSLQTTVDAFGFWRYAAGRLARGLVFGFSGEEERVWNEVRGEAEPWEAEALFRNSDNLELIVNEINDHSRELVERTYRERMFVIGSDLPRVGFNAAGLVDRVHEHYRLPRRYPKSVRLGPPWPLRRIVASWR